MARRERRRRARKAPLAYVAADAPETDADGIRTLAVGAGLWLVAFVMLLPFYDSLRDSDRVWWLWVCIAGFGMGLFGVQYTRWRRRRRLEAEGVSAPTTGRRRAA